METEYFVARSLRGPCFFALWGAWGRGMRIATAGVRTGFAMTVVFFMEAILRTVFAGVAGGGATGRKLLA